METFKKFKIEQQAVRIYVFATGIGLTVYCALLCFGVRHFIAELLCISFAYLLLMGGAWMFRLCWLTWAFIIYSYAIRLCILMYGEGMLDGICALGPVITIAHSTALATGLVLCTIFLRKVCTGEIRLFNSMNDGCDV